jgi:ribosomal protein L16 Arg81 hydroxylase
MGTTSRVHALDRLLAPIASAAFVESYWEQAPLVVSRSKPDAFADLLSIEAIDRILSTMRLRGRDLRIAQEGSLLPTSSYCGSSDGEDNIDLYRAFALFSDGATLILNNAERFWAPLRELVAGLANFFGGRVQANVYVTPPSSRGFTAHYDTHDVFLLQVAGAKSWRVCASSVALPLAAQPYDDGVAEKTDTQQEFRLTVGDTLYLPRGFIHEATTQLETSAHITVGVFAPLWIDLLSELIVTAGERDHDLRRSLPLRGLVMDGFDLAPDVVAAVGRLGDAQLLATARDRLVDRMTSSQEPLLKGQLSELASHIPIELNTRLRRRESVAFTLRDEGESVVLSFCRRTIRFPKYVKSHLEFIVCMDELRAAELPSDLDDDGKLVLARRLVREGFLLRISDS